MLRLLQQSECSPMIRGSLFVELSFLIQFVPQGGELCRAAHDYPFRMRCAACHANDGGDQDAGEEGDPLLA